MNSEVNFEDANVGLKLSVLKPIYGTWSVESDCQGNKSCLAHKRETKMIKNPKVSKKSRNLNVAKYENLKIAK